MTQGDFHTQTGGNLPHGDLRSAKRASLVIRSAKLICQSGEYPCVVRDVSSGGAKLRLFHPCPPESYMLLEMANGDTYAMQMVWQKGNEAGFRFARPVTVDDLIEEQSEHPRRPLRFAINAAMQVSRIDSARGEGVAARLVNLSQAGACIESAVTFAVRQPIRFALPGLPARFARVVWRRGNCHGLVFEQAMTMADLAAHALALQPLATDQQLAQMPLLFDSARAC